MDNKLNDVSRRSQYILRVKGASFVQLAQSSIPRFFPFR